MGKFGVVVAHIDEKSSEQLQESLAAAGIIDKNGKLSRKYSTKK